MASKGYFKKYYRKHRAKRIKQSSEWHAAHRAHRERYMREYYKKNPTKFPRRTREQQDRYNAQRRREYASNPEKRAAAIAQVKKWAKANPEKRLAQRLRDYGITIEEYRAIAKRQKDKCAICGNRQNKDHKRFKRLHLDHCHTTNRVRGLLCSSCNLGLGKFQHSAKLLANAALYLQRFTKNPHK